MTETQKKWSREVATWERAGDVRRWISAMTAFSCSRPFGAPRPSSLAVSPAFYDLLAKHIRDQDDLLGGDSFGFPAVLKFRGIPVFAVADADLPFALECA